MRESSILKQPSAWIPVALSLAALATVLGHVAIYGAARKADEGAAAHIFQLLLVAQLPVIVFFAVKWLPRSPGQATRILVLQAVAALAALAPVYFLNL